MSADYLPTAEDREAYDQWLAEDVEHGDLAAARLVVAPDQPADPYAELWAARPFLTTIHTFARARRVSPWAVLGVTLARIITATPNQVCLPPIVGRRASLNLFVGLVGPSGAGKGAAEGAAEDLLPLHLRTARIASGEAIAHVFKERRGKEICWRDDSHAALISVAEIDRLSGQSARQGSTILADLRSAWSGETLGQVAADSTRSISLEAHQYRLCLIAGIQPERAGVLLDDADGGTPQRFLWLPALDEDAPDVAPEEPPGLTWTVPPVSDRVGIGGARMGVCARAANTIDRSRVERLRGVGEALDGHALLTQLKTAAALALADDRLDINDHDWHLAGLIARKSASVRRNVVTTLESKKQRTNTARAEADAARAVHVDQAREDRTTRRACGTLRRRLAREEAGSWIPRSELRKSLAAKDRIYFDTAIEHMTSSGEVEIDDTSTRTDQYRLKEQA